MLASAIVYLFLGGITFGGVVLTILYFLNSRDKAHLEEEYQHHLDDPEEIFKMEFRQYQRQRKNGQVAPANRVGSKQKASRSPRPPVTRPVKG